MKEVLAIIPARGGSKGVPRKNIRQLAGKPLIGWTIETAIADPGIQRVIVSTDDEMPGLLKDIRAESLFANLQSWLKIMCQTSRYAIMR